MKVTLNNNPTFTVEGLTADQLGYLIACLGVQSDSAEWQYALYVVLSDFAEENGIKHQASDFANIKRPDYNKKGRSL